MYGILIPIVAMFIPIVAIVGGITAAIFRTVGQQKVAEWAMKERIAAIEKGIDPATLPPLPVVGDPAELAMRERIAAIEKGIDPATLPPLPSVGDPGELRDGARTPRERALELAQGLHIAAAITFTAGVGLALMLAALTHGEYKPYWVIGVLPMCVGLGLWLSARVVERGAAPKAGQASSPGA